jgi:pyruvate dehydrogenase E2 component (dihydrolipoamide acetyltransferase)
MPKLSDTMTEGVVAEWHKKVGDHINSGDLLAEIETDKATMEFESFQEGTLLYIGVEKGNTAPVDSILAILGDKGEDISSILADEKSVHAKSEVKEEPKPTEPKAEVKETSAPPKVESAPAPSVSSIFGRVKASPLARKIAEEKGIDINKVNGSGDGGRIVKADIDNFVPQAVSSASVGVESFTEEPVSQMRKTIARRLGESKFTAPHFYLTIEIDMDNAMSARKAINESGQAKVSFNDFVVKAAAVALKRHPKVNSSWLGDKIRYNNHVNVGVAVAVPDGLLVPVVRFADTKSLSQISAEVKDYAQKAKDKKLQPQDWEGNTFSISNLGMFGIEEFTAIINPPDACIMAVGAIIEKAVVKNGNIVASNRMKVTLSCDHRVVDGASGSEFLATFKQMLENPIMMIA